jgi:3-hydroxyisobutyrate dehydrogenase and related beta-hydroxyacid dehydrogenases
LYESFKEKNTGFVDAPVSGGQAGAQNGVLTVMAGGNKADYLLLKDLITNCYTKEFRYMGPAGSGQLTKMVNQVCIAGVLQGLAEGLAFGLKAGLDMDDVLAVLREGAAQSWQLENRGKTMVRDEFDFGFALEWMVKDLKIVLAEAEQKGCRMDVTRLVLEYYQDLQTRGFGRLDTSALIKRLTA